MPAPDVLVPSRQNTYIDLTLSDSESEGGGLISRNPLLAPTSRLPQDHPPSHHQLRPHSYLEASKRDTSNSTMAPHKTLAAGNSQSRGNNAGGILKRSSFDRRSIDQASNKHGIEHTIPDAAVSTKRRKLDDGVLSTRNGNTPRDSTSRLRRQPSRQNATTTPDIRAAPIQRTVITGLHREAAGHRVPRRLIEAPIKGSAHMTERQEYEQRVIQKQVLPHVHEAVRGYRDNLSREDRRDIGTKTARALTIDPTFVEILKASSNGLPPSYEHSLSIKAVHHAKQLANGILDSRAAQKKPTEFRIPSVILDPPKTSSPGLISQPRAPTKKSSLDLPSPASDDTPDAGQVFDRVSVQGLAINGSRSNSPSTSFSNEPTDGDMDKDGESGNDSRRSGRSTRAAQPRYVIGRKRAGRAEMAARQETKSRSESDLRTQRRQIDFERSVPAPMIAHSDNHLEKTHRFVGGGAGRGGRWIDQEGNEVSRNIIAAKAAPPISTNLQARSESSPNPPIRSTGQPSSSAYPRYICGGPGDGGRWIDERGYKVNVPAGRQVKNSTAVAVHPSPRIVSTKGANLPRQTSGPEMPVVRRRNKMQMEAIRAAEKAGVESPEWTKIPAAEMGSDLPQAKQIDPKKPQAQTRVPVEGLVYQQIESNTHQDLDVAEQTRPSSPIPTIARDQINGILRMRELDGIRPSMLRRGQTPFKSAIASNLQDRLVRQSEWTDCSGDITSITWTGCHSFVCGALAHSDSFNMQYNKPGNLLVGSLSEDTLRSFADHRIVRPTVFEADNAENALDSMRRTQDPWLYTSVVSTAYSEKSGLTFTASFDQTVKVWTVSENGSSMDHRGTWNHEGKVNFVVTSPHHDRVATACDTNLNAVRVYKLHHNDIAKSPYDQYCGNKSLEQGQEKWAYRPSSIQWGKSHRVVDLLLVGYSPRAMSGDDMDIPEGRRNSGELCLWNTLDNAWVTIASARTQNVFEVLWHPTQPIFLAATSPCGTYDTDTTKTQVRLFAQSTTGVWMNVKTLDCPALDINELTIMPNSDVESFVTASCTDGNTYVWDTHRGDLPVHVLRHEDSLDNPDHDLPRELADDGVKFAAWGQTSDRFYTGASDGILKVWDIKAPAGGAYVRTLLALSGGIQSGAFSKDFSKLLIGDSTGKLHYLSIDNSDMDEVAPATNPSSRILDTPLANCILPSSVRRPKVIIPHAEPPSPSEHNAMSDIEQTARDIAHTYLEQSQLRRFPNGVFQGSNYQELMLFRYDAHLNNDASQELLPEILSKQQFQVNAHRKVVQLRIPQLQQAKPSDPALHEHNLDLDFDFARLSLDTQKSLTQDKVEFRWDNPSYKSYKFDFQMTPEMHFLWPKTKD